MVINYDVLTKIMDDLTYHDDVTVKCKEEIEKFVQTRDLKVFSLESRQDLYGFFILVIKPRYEAITGQYIPNIFAINSTSEEQPHGDQI